MAGLLNPKFSNYMFRFPPDFFYPEVEEKYDTYLKSIITNKLIFLFKVRDK